MIAVNKWSNKIELTRGDTARIQIAINTDDGTYTPEEGDVVRFAMKKKHTDDTAILEKSIPINTLLLELLPEDTAALDRGSYVYDVEITLASGEVYTFIEGAFILRGDVK